MNLRKKLFLAQLIIGLFTNIYITHAENFAVGKYLYSQLAKSGLITSETGTTVLNNLLKDPKEIKSVTSDIRKACKHDSEMVCNSLFLMVLKEFQRRIEKVKKTPEYKRNIRFYQKAELFIAILLPSKS